MLRMFCSVYVVCLVTNECGAGDGGDAVRGANAGLDHFSQVDSSASVSGKTRHSCRERNKHTTTKPLTKTHLPPPSSPRAPASHAYIELLNLTDDVPLLPAMTQRVGSSLRFVVGSGSCVVADVRDVATGAAVRQGDSKTEVC